jgi:hypothetical protein
VRVFSSPELILVYSKRWSPILSFSLSSSHDWTALENPGLQLTFSSHPVSDVVWFFFFLQQSPNYTVWYLTLSLLATSTHRSRPLNNTQSDPERGTSGKGGMGCGQVVKKRCATRLELLQIGDQLALHADSERLS